MSDSPWISVKDSLPVCGERVLVIVQYKIPISMVTIRTAAGFGWELDGTLPVSHWMPIPALIIDPDVYEASLKALAEPELPL